MKMGKLKKFILISIIVLICLIFRESSAQNPRSNRKKSNGNNLQKINGINHRINQSPNDGISQQNVKQKRPGSSQRRRTKSSHQRQDHHG